MGNKTPLISGTYRFRELQAFKGSNLLLHSENLANNSWTKNNVTVQINVPSIPDPFNNNTTNKLIINSGQNSAYISQTVTNVPIDTSYSFSTYIKPTNYYFVALKVEALSGSGNTVVGDYTLIFDLSAGLPFETTSSQNGSFLDYEIIKAGDIEPWYRLSVVGLPYDHNTTPSSTHSVRVTIIPLISSTNTPLPNNQNGNGVDGLFLWGTQLEISNRKVPAYVATTNQPERRIYRYGGQAGNLIFFSQEFANNSSTGWTRQGISSVLSNVEKSPYGILEASKILESTQNVIHKISHTASLPNDGQYTVGVYAKKAERRYLHITLDNEQSAVFDLQDGVIVTKGDFDDAFIEFINNGWYRCSITYEFKPNATILAFGPSNETGTAYTGVINSGIFVWGAQAERAPWLGEDVITSGAPYTRLSNYDFSTLDNVEPNLQQPNSINYLLWSEDFVDSRGLWVTSNNTTVDASQLIDPPLVIAGSRATKLIEGSTSSLEGFRLAQTHEVEYEWDQSYDGRYTFSIYVKKGIDRDFVRIDLDALSVTNVFLGRVSAVINLTTGEFTEAPTEAGYSFIPTGSVIPLDNGWYRIILTCFFGIPDNNIITFNDEKIQTFMSEDVITFMNILKDFDINPIKQIRPRIIISNGPNFNDIEYQGNNNSYLLIWGAQLEAGPIATNYARSTSGMSRSYDGTLTRIKTDTVYYFPIIRFARNETTFAFLRDATYDRSRRTTGKDTLVLYNNNIGYNNSTPTFNLDVSGSIASVQATIPTISTNNLYGESLQINNFETVLTKGNLSVENDAIFTTLSSFDNVVTTNLTILSTIFIPRPTSEEELIELGINESLITQNFFISGEFLESETITALTQLTSPLINSQLIEVDGNLLPFNANVLKNISPKNLLNFTEQFDDGGKNLIPNSEALDLWSGNASIQANQDVGAFGNQRTAERISFSSVSRNDVFQNFVPRLNIPYTASIYLRSASETQVRIYLNQTCNIFLSGIICNLTPEWQRFVITIPNTPSTETAYFGIDNITDNTNSCNGTPLESEFFAWGAQVEESLEVTNYLPTTSIYWTKTNSSVLANTLIAPNGTVTAEKFIETSTNGWPRILKSEQYVTSTNPYTYSVYVSASERRYFGIDIRETDITLSFEQLIIPRVSVVFDLVDGTIVSPLTSSTTAQALSAGIISVDNNWKRIFVSFIPNIEPQGPTVPSSIRIRNSILENVDPSTLTVFNAEIERPSTDINISPLQYVGTSGFGVGIWGAQLELGNTITEYTKNEAPILPDIYTNNIIGFVPIDPELTNPVEYNPFNELRVDRNVNLVFGIKPSDSFSSDDRELVRSLSGDWDQDHNDDFGVFKPFFKNPLGVIDYINAQGLFGNTLTILVYEDIIGGNEPPNPSPWLVSDSRYNPEPTTPVDKSGLGSSQLFFRYRRAGAGGAFAEYDFFSTEWLGANYPALTAAGLKGGTYGWPGHSGNINTPDNWESNRWMAGATTRLGRNIRFTKTIFQGLHNIKNRINSPLDYFIKQKPFDARSPKIIARSYMCNSVDSSGNFNINGSGFTKTDLDRKFGVDANHPQGNPDLFLRSWQRGGYFNRFHPFQWDVRSSSVVELKNLVFECETNATQVTPLWFYGSANIGNVVIAMLGNIGNTNWGGGVYEEGFINSPDSIINYCGELQIDPYFLTEQTWNTNDWNNVLGASDKAYYPGFAIAIKGNEPNGPYYPTPQYSYFHAPFWYSSSSYFLDRGTPNRQFGRNCFLQSSVILDGQWNCSSTVNNLFTKSRQATIATTGLVFKGDTYEWHPTELRRGNAADNYQTTYEFTSAQRNYGNFYTIRADRALWNLYDIGVGVSPWTFNTSVLPQLSAYPGTALYSRNRTSLIGTWDTRWWVPITDGPFQGAIDVTGNLSPIKWFNSQTGYTWNNPTRVSNNVYTLEGGPSLTNTANRYIASIDGYFAYTGSFTVNAASREISFNTSTPVYKWEVTVKQPNTNSVVLPAGPLLASSSSDVVVRINNILIPSTDYNINVGARTITFNTSIPITLITGLYNVNNNSYRVQDTRYSSATVTVDLINISTQSNIRITKLSEEAFINNTINSIVQRPPYWLRTAEDQFILSGHVSPNDLNNYREWYTIPSPINPSLTSTLVYWTSSER